MNKEEIEDILEELHLVRPEILKPKAKKLFEAIMSIADERDELQQGNQKYKEVFDKAIGYIEKCLKQTPTENRTKTDDTLDIEYEYILGILKEVE